VNFADLKHASHANEIELAAAPEFADIFPGCVVDAIPPFGNLYGLEVLIADSLSFEEEITFNAGTPYGLIKMAYDDYRCLVQPKVIKLSIATVH
jgi:Ala-tRNA(Pro) deacylase